MSENDLKQVGGKGGGMIGSPMETSGAFWNPMERALWIPMEPLEPYGRPPSSKLTPPRGMSEIDLKQGAGRGEGERQFGGGAP